jgi:hypothetical protein
VIRDPEGIPRGGIPFQFNFEKISRFEFLGCYRTSIGSAWNLAISGRDAHK